MPEVKLDILVGAIDKARPVLMVMESKIDAMAKRTQDFQDRWGGVMGVADAVGSKMMVAGGIIVGTLTAAGLAAGHTGAELENMHLRTGVSVEMLSTLGSVAKRTGAELGDVELGLRFVSRNAYMAAQGNDEAVKKFQSLGIELRDTKGNLKSTADLFLEVSNVIRNAAPGERQGIAMSILGRGGAALIPMMIEAKGSLTDIIAEAERLGTAFSGKDADAAKAFEDSLLKLQGAAKRAFLEMGMKAVPTLSKLVELLMGATQAVRKFAVEHPTLAKYTVLVGGGLGLIALGLGKTMTFLSGAIQGWESLSAAMAKNAVAAQATAAANAEAGAAAAAGGAGANAGARVVGASGIIPIAGATAAVIGILAMLGISAGAIAEVKRTKKSAEENTADLDKRGLAPGSSERRGARMQWARENAESTGGISGIAKRMAYAKLLRDPANAAAVAAADKADEQAKASDEKAQKAATDWNAWSGTQDKVAQSWSNYYREQAALVSDATAESAIGVQAAEKAYELATQRAAALAGVADQEDAAAKAEQAKAEAWIGLLEAQKAAAEKQTRAAEEQKKTLLEQAKQLATNVGDQWSAWYDRLRAGAGSTEEKGRIDMAQRWTEYDLAMQESSQLQQSGGSQQDIFAANMKAYRAQTGWLEAKQSLEIKFSASGDGLRLLTSSPEVRQAIVMGVRGALGQQGNYVGAYGTQ